MWFQQDTYITSANCTVRKVTETSALTTPNWSMVIGPELSKSNASARVGPNAVGMLNHTATHAGLFLAILLGRYVFSILTHPVFKNTKNCTDILYFIIVRERRHFETTAPRGLKFWLQVALSAPIATAWKQNRKSGCGKTGFCPEIFFRFFRFYGPLGTSGSLPGGSRTT